MINSRLGFEEPKDATEAKSRDDKMRKWYSALDANGDGTIDPSEYFVFALREAIFRAEEEAGEIFALAKDALEKDQSTFSVVLNGDLSLHSDKEKQVTRKQFKRLTRRLGFDEGVGLKIFDDVWTAHALLNNKRPSASGKVPADASIDAAYLLYSIHAKTNELKPMMKEWMVGKSLLNNQETSRDKLAPGVPITRLNEETLLELQRLQGDIHGLLRKLRSVLRADIQVAQAMFCAWDTNASFAISFKEFCEALVALGFSSNKELAEAIFDELDDDGSFFIGFAEFKAWLFSSDEEFERRLLR